MGKYKSQTFDSPVLWEKDKHTLKARVTVSDTGSVEGRYVYTFPNGEERNLRRSSNGTWVINMFEGDVNKTGERGEAQNQPAVSFKASGTGPVSGRFWTNGNLIANANLGYMVNISKGNPVVVYGVVEAAEGVEDSAPVAAAIDQAIEILQGAKAKLPGHVR